MTTDPESKKVLEAIAANEPVYRMVTSAVGDRQRIDWLEADAERLEDVRGYVNNEGGTIRDAIDELSGEDRADML
jgi:hypothetical protein